jgi:predicted HicB family RNase H-like nuclease
MNVMTYKGYNGVFEYYADDNAFHGQVAGITDVVHFTGTSIDELKQALADSVEDYLEFCAEQGKEPQKPYSGRFNVRIKPELHQRIASRAAQDGKSLNAWVAEALSKVAADHPSR